MKSISGFLVVVLTLTGVARGDEMRTWTSTQGETIEAKLIEQNQQYVILENEEGQRAKMRLHVFSEADRSYLRDRRLQPEIAPLPPAENYKLPLGKVTDEIKCGNRERWSYHLYLPSFFNPTREWPVLFVMSPGGGSPGTLNRYVNGAEKNGWMLAVSRQSKNGFDKSEEAVLAMIEDVRAKHPVDEDRMYSSGFSGGARMAFVVAKQLKREPLAGVLACGAGGNPASVDRGTVVYGLSGTNCFNRWDMACTHEKLRNDDSRLWFFPGNHEWANAELIFDGMCWLNGCYLKDARTSNANAKKEKYRYTMMMLEHIRGLIEDNPERAYRLARFMDDFDVPREFTGDLRSILAALRQKPAIKEYDKAEKAMYDLASEYFATNPMDYRNNNCPEKLTKDAEKLAQKYKDLDLAETIRKMGNPAPTP